MDALERFGLSEMFKKHFPSPVISDDVPPIQVELDANNELRSLSIRRIGLDYTTENERELKPCFAPRTLQEATL